MGDTASIAPELLAAWLTARSVARNLPPPVADRGGLRVDTNSTKEAKRWVFASVTQAITDLAHEIDAPRHFIKACAPQRELDGATSPRWRIQASSYVMTLGVGRATPALPLPAGYRIYVDQHGPTTLIRIKTHSGELAASGYATEAAGVFIYDRIETEALHRRRGLARVVMGTLGAARTSPRATQVLVATEDGRGLYAGLGWSVIAPYSTATIPEPVETHATGDATGIDQR